MEILKKILMAGTIIILVAGIALAATFGYFSHGYRDWTFLHPQDQTADVAEPESVSLTIIKGAIPRYFSSSVVEQGGDIAEEIEGEDTAQSAAIVGEDNEGLTDVWPKEIVIGATIRPRNLPNALNWEIRCDDGTADVDPEDAEFVVADDELSATLILHRPTSHRYGVQATAKASYDDDIHARAYCDIWYMQRLTFSIVNFSTQGIIGEGIKFGSTSFIDVLRDTSNVPGQAPSQYMISAICLKLPSNIANAMQNYIKSLGYSSYIEVKQIARYEFSDNYNTYVDVTPRLDNFFEILKTDAQSGLATAFDGIKRQLLGYLAASQKVLEVYAVIDAKYVFNDTLEEHFLYSAETAHKAVMVAKNSEV